MTADFAIIIPARFASTRYPGKPLVEIRGAGGVAKTLIQRSWECAKSVPGSSGVWVATDDERIADAVRRFGGEVIMTSPECANGTERCAEAVRQLPNAPDIIVNLQGDAPLSPAAFVPELVQALVDDGNASMATPVVRCSPALYRHLADDAASGRVGGTTAVFDQRRRALYFSKRILPFLSPEVVSDRSPVYLHLGLYAYRRNALQVYSRAQATPLEQLEGLEQLRFLELGLSVAVVPMEPLKWEPIELNNPSDVEIIEQVLLSREIA